MIFMLLFEFGVIILEYEFQKYPQSVVSLAGEIRRVSDDYNARKIGNDEINEIVIWYASQYPDLLFEGPGYRPAIKAILGKKRVRLLDKALNGYQPTLFSGVK